MIAPTPSAQPSVPQRPTETTLDLITVNVIATSLRAAQPDNASLHRALDKALEQLRLGRAWMLRDNILEVQSASQPWVTHTCTIAECSCPTTQGVCWHRALAAVAITASTLHAAAAACVPLAGMPRGPRLAQPKAQVMVEYTARRESWRERTRSMSQAELDAACNDGLF